MRAAIFNEPRSVSVGERPDAAIAEPTDAIVRVVLSCVCGSDLWYYRGDSPFDPGPIGHEFIGVVEDIGSDVRKVQKGDFVIAPFAFSEVGKGAGWGRGEVLVGGGSFKKKKTMLVGSGRIVFARSTLFHGTTFRTAEYLDAVV